MTDTPNTHDQAAETMTAETALEHLVVFTAMEDAQLATDCERVIKAALTAERTARQEAEARAEAAERERPKRDPMIDRSEEDWDALEDATMVVYGWRAGRTLTDDDIAALHLVDRCQRDDEETATDAYHRGHEEGLRERGGDELVQLDKRTSAAMVDRAAERAMRKFAEARATALEAQLAAAREALEFYADPATYHACSFLFDRPTGGFDEDFSDDHGDPDYGRPMPGKLARAALAPHPEKEEADHA